MEFLQEHWNLVLGGVLVAIGLIGYIITKPKKAKKAVR